ncbi:MAG: thiopurine S-methyltransferase [Wenzhouxiangellaceae bacterium]|nr:thiopurine S-methyltransferase [Wenzhouxiangellaceae bacterium]
MEPEFWHERWRENRIGFHRDEVHPALMQHWGEVAGSDHSAVLVPLCGKSPDLHWLAESGHPVFGVELSPLAIEQFFDEAGFPARRIDYGGLPAWQAGRVCLVEGDFFAFQPPSPFGLCYDRAALIALPPTLRGKYLEHLAMLLAPGARGLLVTLEYDQARMDGPPFSVGSEELAACEVLAFRELARNDVLSAETRFAERGLRALHEVCWQVQPS